MKQAVAGGTKGRIDIYNDDGEWLVSIVGNEAGFFERGAEPTALSTDAMYETAWAPLEERLVRASAENRHRVRERELEKHTGLHLAVR